MEQTFMILSGLVIAIGYFILIKDTIKGLIIPNPTTWFIFFIQDCLMASSAIMVGIGPTLVMPVTWGVGAGIMFFLSLTRGPLNPLTGVEKMCLILSAVGISLWATTGSPLLALIASVSSSCVGSIPTIIKCWLEPWTETPTGWVLMLVGTLFSSMAIQEWTLISGFFLVTVGIFQAVLILPLVLYSNGLYAGWKTDCT